MADRLQDFIVTFCTKWRAGTNARMVVECHAGQAWILLHKSLGYPPLLPQYDRQPPQPQTHHKASPSRLRHRAKRAQAFAAASAATKTAKAAVKTGGFEVAEVVCP